MTSVRLDDRQKEFIEQSGLTQSDFIRRSVDYYILYLQNPHSLGLLNELEQWVQLKRNTFETNMGTDVTQMGTSVPHMVTDVTQMGTSVPNMNTNVPTYTTNNTNVTQKSNPHINKTNKNTLTDKLQKELPMIQRLLKNPETSNTIPDCTLKILSKKYDINKSTIQSWITENKKWIIEEKFMEEYPE